MSDEQKREHAEMVRELADAIRHSLGMAYGPPMEGKEGWVAMIPDAVGDADDESFEELASAIDEALREAKERRAAQIANAPKPTESTDPWAVIGKAEDDGERIMDITRNFG